MADKTRSQNLGSEKKKKKYRWDGTPIWGKRYIEGPGVWVSCVKGKESQAVAECYDLFHSVASKLWPVGREEDAISEGEEDVSIEAQIAKEVAAMKRPRVEPRFVIFISCKPPVDPVELITNLVNDVAVTGVVASRYIHRLVPVSASCVTNPPEIQTLCRSICSSFFSQYPEKKFTYKIELRMRNHSVITRPTLIQTIAECVPEGHTVSLENPEIFILVEVFKSICGISVVRDYYKLHKFNITEVANGGDRLGTRLSRLE